MKSRAIIAVLSFLSFFPLTFAYAKLPECFKEEHWTNSYENFRMTNQCNQTITVIYDMQTKEKVERRSTRLICGQSYLEQYFKGTHYNVVAVESSGQSCGTSGKKGNTNSSSESTSPEQGSKSSAPKTDFSPGFDCSKATTNVEVTICGVERLSRADNNLNSAYKQLMERVTSPSEIARIKQDQRAFLDKRNRCKSPICIDEAYTARTEELYDEIRAANDVVTSQPVPDDPLVPKAPMNNDVPPPPSSDAAQCAEPNGYAKCMSENGNRHYCWTQLCCYPRFPNAFISSSSPEFFQCEREFQQSGQ